MSAYASALVCNAQGRYNCPHCDSHFSREDSALRHIENSCPSLFPEKKVPPKEGDCKRNARGRYNCPHCDVDFAENGGVTVHLKRERCTVLFPEKKAKTKKKKAPPKEGEYTRNARGRYNCPHCEAHFSRGQGVFRHVKNSCPALFSEEKLRYGDDEPMLPVGSQVSVVWEGERYPATIIVREIEDWEHFYDVQYNDGSYGEDLTVEMHELQMLDSNTKLFAETNVSAQKRTVTEVGDDLQQQQPQKKAKLNGSINTTDDTMVVGSADAVGESIVGQLAVVHHAGRLGFASQDISALQNTIKIMQASTIALELKALAAEEAAKYYEDETSTMHVFSGKQTSTIDRLKELALNAGVDVAIVIDAAKVK